MKAAKKGALVKLRDRYEVPIHLRVRSDKEHTVGTSESLLSHVAVSANDVLVVLKYNSRPFREVKILSSKGTGWIYTQMLEEL
jgi:hypothetical protein